MSANPVGTVGQSWRALQAHAEDHTAAQTDLNGAQHESDAGSVGEHDHSSSGGDPSKAPATDTSAGSGPQQSGSTHIVDHGNSSGQGQQAGQNAQGNSGSKTNGQDDGKGAANSGQQNSQTGNLGNVTNRPQGNGQPESNGDGTGTGTTGTSASASTGTGTAKLDGKNAGWGDGDSGGQNKGFGDVGGKVGDSGGNGNWNDNGNGANWDGSRGNGGGLLDSVGNTVNSLLFGRSGDAATNSYQDSSLSFTNTYAPQQSSYLSFTDTYAPQEPSYSDNHDDSHPVSLLSSVSDAANGAVHDVGQAAASLFGGQSGNRVDPSHLTDKSFNDWAGSKSESNGPSLPESNGTPRPDSTTNSQIGKGAADEPATPESVPSGLATDPAANNPSGENEQAASPFAGSDETAIAGSQAEDAAAQIPAGRAADGSEELALTPGSEESEATGVGALTRDIASASATDGKPVDAGKQAGQAEDDGPAPMTMQARPGQAQGDTVRSAGEEAQTDAAAQRQGLTARTFDSAVNARSANFADSGIRQTANEQTQQQPMQNPIYVGEGKQTLPDVNQPLVASVERVDAVAANWNIEQDEMTQNEHLDTQQMLMRQFTPALVGISALISSAIGGTTMLVSPGGSAAPFLLGVSALLFGMGAWRSSSAARTQLADDRSWAQMLGDPAARQSLIATGANSLGLAGSIGLSLLALV